jgi:hypothetical protein
MNKLRGARTLILAKLAGPAASPLRQYCGPTRNEPGIFLTCYVLWSIAGGAIGGVGAFGYSILEELDQPKKDRLMIGAVARGLLYGCFGYAAGLVVFATAPVSFPAIAYDWVNDESRRDEYV